MKRLRFCCYGFTVLLAWGLGVAQALPDEQNLLITQQQGCTETETAQAPWVQWALHTRKACITGSGTHDELTECLQRAKTTLANLEGEHASIYLAEVRSLPPDHPVMRAIFVNLREKAKAAVQVIEQDYSPMQMAVISAPASCRH